jgi:hypothetical protein
MSTLRERNHCQTCSRERKLESLETVVDALGQPWVQCKERQANGECEFDLVDCPVCHAELTIDEIDCLCEVCGWYGSLRDAWCGNTISSDKQLF